MEFIRFYEAYDKRRYTKLLEMQDCHNKEYFNKDGCGLEIEFGVEYEYRCRVYIETGLKKLKEFVGSRGKFVPDRSIGEFLNVEIVLDPFLKGELKEIFGGIKTILDFYENFVFNDKCGIHANFRADGPLKKAFYDVLSDGRYDSERFSHSKYRTDFMAIVTNPDGSRKSFEEYLEYQHQVGAKYVGINFLKEHLVEIRTLNFTWEDVEFFYDAYEEAKKRVSG